MSRWVLLPLMLCVSVLCLAQLDTGTIVGVVSDTSGAVIPNAKITVEEVNTAARVDVSADGAGRFVAPALRIGIYRVTVAVSGFQTYLQEGIRLSVNDRLDLSIVLRPGPINEQVTVSSAAPVLETASTTLGAVVSEQQVTDLPLSGRAVDQLARLAPGVVYLGRRSTSGQGQGLWTPGTRWLVDGGDSSQVDSDLAYGGYGSQARVTRISVDAVGEFRQVNSMYSAEYGQSGMGVVNFISKSGTNQYHGGVFEFLRNNAFDARDYFNKVGSPQPAFRMNQFGGTFGGPIIRDKLFFFGDYEGVRQSQGLIYNVFVPTQAYRDSLAPELRPAVDMLPLPNGPVSAAQPLLASLNTSRSNILNENTFMLKADYQASLKDHFTVRYNYNRSYNRQYFGVAEAQYRNIPATPQTGMISYTRTISPSLVNQFGFYLNRWGGYTTAAGTDAVRAFPQTSFGDGSAFAGPSTWDMDVRNTSFTYLDTLSWVKGAHQFKFGFQLGATRANKLVNYQQFATFLSLADYKANKPYALRTEGWPRPGIRGKQYDAFVQDDWRVTRNLTLNIGMRYKYDAPPTESHGNIANFDVATGKVDAPGTQLFDSPKLNFAPRVGLAYMPFHSQKTVIRAGYGLFHVYLNAAETQFLPTNIKGFGQRYSFNIQQDPTVKGFPFPDISRFPATTTIYAFPKDWHRAYTQNWNFNIQQSVLDQNTILQVGYVGSHGVNFNRAVEGNLFIPGTSVKTYPGLGSIYYSVGGATNAYHSLQTAFKRRMSHGLGFDVYYTWSHGFDDGAGNGQIPWDRRSEWATSDLDTRHNLTFAYTWDIPVWHALPNWLGGGWQVNGITSMRAGQPIDFGTNRDPFGIGVTTARPNFVPGVDIRPGNFDLPSNQINLAAFAPVANGSKQWGNVGRNFLTGPPAYNWDFSLFKQFQITEAQRVEFRAEVFNMFNTPQFNNPGAVVTSPATFGKSLSTQTAAGSFGSYRSMQFGLKYNF